MPNVHNLNESRDNSVEYHEIEIHISHRQETNDFVYEFVKTKEQLFTGHASTYDNALTKAKKYIDILTATKE